jgi:hypothetical protein
MNATQEVLLIESSIGQVERDCSRFARNFITEIDEMISISPSQTFARVSIDPLHFLTSACNRFKQIEAADAAGVAPGLLPDREQFNLAANAMLRALAKTLGPDLSAGTREAWINALRTIAEREPIAARAREVA